ncbi:hypothetical protein TNCV_2479111 [Trichonephila clavipes]|nr:hypothetical protein TNCV_2479111 [Trichonephila clavipes]
MWVYSDGSIRGNFELPKVSYLGFGNDSKMAEISVNVRSTDHFQNTTPNEDQYLAVTAKRKGQSTEPDCLAKLPKNAAHLRKKDKKNFSLKNCY